MFRSGEGNGNYSDAYFDKHEQVTRSSARQVVPFIMSVLQPIHIADIGCGSGQWTKEFILNGAKKAYAFDAFASPLWKDSVNHVEFQNVDLEKNSAEFPTVDLVCWLEVAEHLSEPTCKRVMHYIVRRTEAVLFSCAIPGQYGTGHVSERWLSDWVSDFGERGFCCADVLRPRFWRDEKVSWWYRQNAVIFVKQNSEASNAILSFQLPTFGGMDLVHPELFKSKCGYLGQIEDRY